MSNNKQNNVQHRITREQAKEFAKWLFISQDFNEMLQTTSEAIRLKYFNHSGVLVSRRFVDDQFNRWIPIDNDVYKISEPWTHPKNILQS